MARVIERDECGLCGEPSGVCMCEASSVPWRPCGEKPMVARYTREEYLLALLKAARKVLADDPSGPDDLLAAVLWVESDGLGPQALSGAGQLELEA